MCEWVSSHRDEIAAHIGLPAPSRIFSTRAKPTFGGRCSRSRACCAQAGWGNCRQQLCDYRGKERFEQETSRELNLLRDCREVFANLDNPERLATEALINGLASLPESPWLNLTALELSRKLLPFGIRPGQHWIGGRNFRGYARANFLDAFARYLPAPQQQGTKPARGARPARLKAV